MFRNKKIDNNILKIAKDRGIKDFSGAIFKKGLSFAYILTTGFSFKEATL